MISAMNDVAKEGHLDIVQYFHENRSDGRSINDMDNASTEGHLDVVEFCIKTESNDVQSKQ